MTDPKQSGKPSSALEARIKESFGSLDEFKDKFSKSAIGNFGSGWTWLVESAGKLEIVNTSNADTPYTLKNVKPLLTVDVWEHAYYIDYQNRRPDYVQQFWQVVNWKFVEEQLGKQ
eukprot:TRINITY_DN2855_c0_g1_i2.p1 TRINITY_DN2855_c0_g1~~TRINITY_DN2855_c0_g1_i2.p1  ORF type:complete len:116 (+),score=29.86 TRINITY_DN2855_c0_g1_i2:438-785(+)